MCKNASSLKNEALYIVRQEHYERLSQKEDSRHTFWRGDELRWGWNTWYCQSGNYNKLDKELKQSPNYKALPAQAAQQTLKEVAESINAYNGTVEAYYEGTVTDKPKLPKYRKKGGYCSVTIPRQALIWLNGIAYPSISRTTQQEDERVFGKKDKQIKLVPPKHINPEEVIEVRVRPSLGELWADWIVKDSRKPIKKNPDLDYKQAWGFDPGGNNWMTGVSTLGASYIIDGRYLKSVNQGYCRLVAKEKQGHSDFYWNENLDRIQRKRNNVIADAVNKAARFIVNRCLRDGVGNIVIGHNEEQKQNSNMGKRNNQNFVPIPTTRLIKRIQELGEEYGIVVTLTEEANTSRASSLDNDPLPKHGETPKEQKWSGRRYPRGGYKTNSGLWINADCNGSLNIIRKVATQLGLDLTKVGRGALTVPHRYNVVTGLSKSYLNNKKPERCTSEDCVVITILNPPSFEGEERSKELKSSINQLSDGIN